jgi:hypothetical protein
MMPHVSDQCLVCFPDASHAGIHPLSIPLRNFTEAYHEEYMRGSEEGQGAHRFFSYLLDIQNQLLPRINVIAITYNYLIRTDSTSTPQVMMGREALDGISETLGRGKAHFLRYEYEEGYDLRPLRLRLRLTTTTSKMIN